MKKVPSSYSTPGTPTKNRSPSRQENPTTMKPASSNTNSQYGAIANNRLLTAFTYSASLLIFFNLFMVHRNLITSPVKSLVENVPLVILLQAGYCILAKLTRASNSTTTSNSKKQPHSSQLSLGTQFSSIALSTILSLILSVLVFGLLILFGAPVTSLLPDTFFCAVHISLVSVMPLVYVYNLDSTIWRDIISVKLPLNSVYGGAVGTWLGAWLGAIPIPLDWDRPWQQWPITIVGGAYYGTAVGTIIGALYAIIVRKRQKMH